MSIIFQMPLCITSVLDFPNEPLCLLDFGITLCRLILFFKPPEQHISTKLLLGHGRIGCPFRAWLGSIEPVMGRYALWKRGSRMPLYMDEHENRMNRCAKRGNVLPLLVTSCNYCAIRVSSQLYAITYNYNYR